MNQSIASVVDKADFQIKEVEENIEGALEDSKEGGLQLQAGL